MAATELTEEDDRATEFVEQAPSAPVSRMAAARVLQVEFTAHLSFVT
jgi:hypothetical protein